MTDATEINLQEEEELLEAIQIIMAASGFETHDKEILKLVVKAVEHKLSDIVIKSKFRAGSQTQEQEKILKLENLQHALGDMGIQCNRPEYILEQAQGKMGTRRQKPNK